MKGVANIQEFISINILVRVVNFTIMFVSSTMAIFKRVEYLRINQQVFNLFFMKLTRITAKEVLFIVVRPATTLAHRPLKDREDLLLVADSVKRVIIF